MSREDREQLVSVVLSLALIALILACVLLAGCANTEAAIAALPEGWGASTWNLVAAIAMDAWGLIERVAGLLL